MRSILFLVGGLTLCVGICADARMWTSTNGATFDGEFVIIIGDKVVLRDAQGKQRKIPLDRFSEEDRAFIMEVGNPIELDIEFARKSNQYRFPQKREYMGSDTLPGGIDYVFTAKIKQTSSGSYTHELQVEFFAIGEEIDGNNYILLDRQERSFIPGEQKDRSYRFSGREVRLYDYEFRADGRRGQRYGGYMVVITDPHGKIIAHKSSYNWMFGKLEALKKLPLNCHFDKTCTRVFPPRPKVGFQNDQRN
ncbi:MAG: hypothetical protein KAU94_02310 [Verrucomicrobia bacterium]|nr:hypothetical protein [Verrucomicrobiota bacterium]